MNKGYSCSTCRNRGGCSLYRLYNSELTSLHMMLAEIQFYKQQRLDRSTVPIRTWKEFYNLQRKVNLRAFECSKCLDRRVSEHKNNGKDLFYENMEISNRDVPIVEYGKEWYTIVPKFYRKFLKR